MARSTQSLTEFQTALARKLADSAERGVGNAWLGVALHGVRALLPVAQAGEIFQPLALQRLPLSQPWVAGVASLRGRLSVVVDWVALMRRASGPVVGAVDADTLPYWVSLGHGTGANAALLVDRLLGLRSAQEVATHPVPGPLGDSAPAWVTGLWRDGNGADWCLLDLHTLARDPQFLNLKRPVRGDVVATAP